MAQYQLGMTSLNLGQIPGRRRRTRGVSQGGSERSEGGGSEGGTAGTAADAQEVIVRNVRAVRIVRVVRGRSRSNGSNIPNDTNARTMSISDRLTEIRARISAAAQSAGRDPASVRLVAVSKTFPIESIVEAFAAGQRDFGENRVQEALQKIELALQKIDRSADQSIRWHLLGHLQTNKARKAAPAFAMIQSVDSVELHPQARPGGRRHAGTLRTC